MTKFELKINESKRIWKDYKPFFYGLLKECISVSFDRTLIAIIIVIIVGSIVFRTFDINTISIVFSLVSVTLGIDVGVSGYRTFQRIQLDKEVAQEKTRLLHHLFETRRN